MKWLRYKVIVKVNIINHLLINKTMLSCMWYFSLCDSRLLLLGPCANGENVVWRGRKTSGYRLVKGQSQSLNPGLSDSRVLNHQTPLWRNRKNELKRKWKHDRITEEKEKKNNGRRIGNDGMIERLLKKREEEQGVTTLERRAQSQELWFMINMWGSEDASLSV